MAYRKKARRTPRRGTIKSHTRNIRSVMSMQRPTVPRSVRMPNRVEVKRFEHSQSLSCGVDADGQSILIGNSDTPQVRIVNLSAIEQGTESNERTGDLIQILSQNLNYVLFPPDASHKIFHYQVVIFQWMAGTLVPTESDIFESAGGAWMPNQPYVTSRSPMYRILYQNSGTMVGDKTNPQIGNNVIGPVRALLKPKYNRINYQWSDVGTTTATAAGAIYLMFRTVCLDSGVVGSSFPWLNLTSVINYVDP